MDAKTNDALGQPGDCDDTDLETQHKVIDLMEALRKSLKKQRADNEDLPSFVARAWLRDEDV